MKLRYGLALVASAAFFAGSAGPAVAAQPDPAHHAAASGGGVATARSVNVRALARGPQLPAHGSTAGALGISGRPAGAALPVRQSAGRKAPSAATVQPPPGRTAPGARRGQPASHPSQPDRSPAYQVAIPQRSPHPADHHQREFQRGQAIQLQLRRLPAARPQRRGGHHPDRRGGQPPAAGVQQERERAVRHRPEHAPGHQSSPERPAHPVRQPRNRFSMVVTVVPTPGATPSLYLLASQGTSACGSWWVYRLTFNGSFYPAGTLLDYPYLGQDRVSLLLSSNNFCCANSFTYRNSAAFSISKTLVYSGAPVSFTSYPRCVLDCPGQCLRDPDRGDHQHLLPRVRAGFRVRPLPDDHRAGQSHRAAGGDQLTVQCANPPRQPAGNDADPRPARWPHRVGSGPVAELHLVHARNETWAASRRCATGRSACLSNTATVATAYHNATSDDFNPSIGVTNAGGSTIYAWLNWAYTDTAHNRATSDTSNGVLPGTGVPNLIGDRPDTGRGLSHVEQLPVRRLLFGRRGPGRGQRVMPGRPDRRHQPGVLRHRRPVGDPYRPAELLLTSPDPRAAGPPAGHPGSQPRNLPAHRRVQGPCEDSLSRSSS